MIHRFDSIKKDFVKSTTIFIYQLFVNLLQGVLKNTSFIFGEGTTAMKFVNLKAFMSNTF